MLALGSVHSIRFFWLDCLSELRAINLYLISQVDLFCTLSLHLASEAESTKESASNY